ncbi:MAG: hypothetical protein KC416_09910 [Myxococcales bacterium]|nr:hypothetical protein [Myxococcales bacterium]
MSAPGSPRPLAAEHLSLLAEVLEKRAPDLMATLLPKAEANSLGREERLRLCDLVGREFAETGVGADFEPLPRGLRLEELLDRMNRPNIDP